MSLLLQEIFEAVAFLLVNPMLEYEMPERGKQDKIFKAVLLRILNRGIKISNLIGKKMCKVYEQAVHRERNDIQTHEKCSTLGIPWWPTG